jgi:hypothetical protein
VMSWRPHAPHLASPNKKSPRHKMSRQPLRKRSRTCLSTLLPPVTPPSRCRQQTIQSLH